MKVHSILTTVIALIIGIGGGLLLEQSVFSNFSKKPNAKHDWHVIRVRSAETEALRSYILLLEQDRWTRDIVASMNSWTDSQKSERVQRIWDTNAAMVQQMLDRLRQSELEYSEACPGQHSPKLIFGHIQTVLETGEIVAEQSIKPDDVSGVTSL